ncbi:hypothetical protein QBC38DRAFT_498836 [Podospora fimiseda]|uniref:Secreted protein n=1 Tax=Podospora fimiseda TaxID=252190 RepID=A0AAN7BRF6_9PEZI|nr:hypothetical protein QBC38DRAFT_498836 [Podospora fimiseda]
MKSFATIAMISLAMLQTSVLALSAIPTGSPDGIYLSNLDTNGTETWEIVTAITLDKRDKSTSLSPMSRIELSKRQTKINCQNIEINSFDREVAAQNLIDYCGNGNWFGSQAIAVQYGGVVAYGCNYSNGQTCHSWDVRYFLESLYHGCGGNRAAWWRQVEWSATYGYTAVGRGFC